MMFSLKLALSDEDIDGFMKNYNEVKSNMAYPMNQFGDDMTIQVLDSVLLSYVENYQEIQMYDNQSFTFVADYTLRDESKKAGTTVRALIKVSFENQIKPVSKIKESRTFQVATLKSILTCRMVETLVDQNIERSFFYFFEDTTYNSLIGYHNANTVPSKTNLSAFFDQEQENIEVTQTDSETKEETKHNYLMTIEASEYSFDSLLIPVKSIDDTYGDNHKNYVIDMILFIIKILKAGDNLYGKKIIHGDICLENFGYVQTENGLEPKLRLSNNLFRFYEQQKIEENFISGLKLFNDDYVSPWMTSALAEDEVTTLYSYNNDGKDESYAFYQLIQKFAEINGIHNSNTYTIFMRTLNKELKITSQDPKEFPNLFDFYWEASKFRTHNMMKKNNRILI